MTTLLSLFPKTQSNQILKKTHLSLEFQSIQTSFQTLNLLKDLLPFLFKCLKKLW